jgi:hypothetical protein
MEHRESDFVDKGVAAFKCCQIRKGGVGNILKSGDRQSRLGERSR